MTQPYFSLAIATEHLRTAPAVRRKPFGSLTIEAVRTPYAHDPGHWLRLNTAHGMMQVVVISGTSCILLPDYGHPLLGEKPHAQARAICSEAGVRYRSLKAFQAALLELTEDMR